MRDVRHRTLRALASLALLAIPGGAALGAGFEGGHWFVSGNGKILEFDDTDTFVRELVDVSGYGNPSDLVFGPNGNLFVLIFATGVHEFDADGNEVDSFSDASHADNVSFAFGPNGDLWTLASNPANHLVRWDSTGTPQDTFDLTGVAYGMPVVFAVGPEGHFYIGDVLTTSLHRLDPHSPDGTPVCSMTLGATMHSLEFREDGALYGGFDDGDLDVLDVTTGGSLGTVGDAGAVNTIHGFAISPTTELYAAVSGSGEVQVFDASGDPTVVRSIDASAHGVSTPLRVAFAPYRFKVKLSGRVVGVGQPAADLSEKGVLSVLPGHGRVMLALDDPTGPVAQLFGERHCVLQCFESTETDLDKRRLLHGSAPIAPAWENGTTSLFLELTGNMGDDGAWRPKDGTGTFTRSSNQGTAHADLVLKKRLN